MAASYQNLWIIVGMTVTATVLANMSAKPKRSATPSYEVSHLEPNLPSAGTTSGPSNPSTIAAARTANPDKGTATAPASTPPTGVHQFRDIDVEFKSSFDMAARIALASPAVQTPVPVEQPAAETALPSLQTREVRSDPNVFDLETQSPPDASSSTLGTGLTTTNLNMREGPAANYLLVDTLVAGAAVSILEQENGWLHVREVSSGRQGWVNGSYIARTAN
ncbi:MULTISPECIES: SH3 domain-containing protein [Sinorhizobium]|uniref:SH3 domain-containing protein n=1 Tax=Sinorhizobium medicae TaxID=110321 RepID=A0A508XBM4_9HYPH|nr:MULTISPECIES: SH3 domain-containing protein [Sinorhizobium]ASP83043.1 SH3 domain-containing protein [Sinorhizobium meliloti]MDW9744614.1 SH3 domain-containing protein [Sinorhizobium meliloti]MDX0299773.1 SH3 domain-containing protein [Sinorhizobium meliloti]MQW17910.1 SH3 domain-containing protein [Sinorhizobium meliloti]RVH96127.1 SH3 domain-containing protein [Sinorhizobium meliloti]